MNLTSFPLSAILLMFTFSFSLGSNQASAMQQLEGDWNVNLNVGTADEPEHLPFGVSISVNQGTLGKIFSAELVNGIERIPVGPTNFQDGTLTIEIPHYASQLSLKDVDSNATLTGQWTKRRGKDNLATVPCQMIRSEEPSWESPADYVGRWSVQFEGEEDLAIGEFKKAKEGNAVLGTFLTTTGDYRYLAGGVRDGTLTLSCFDGGHAFLFSITTKDTENGVELAGDFHSGNWYRITWTATRDNDATLPDAFQQTVWSDKVNLSDLSFPNLDGESIALDAEQFAGKCRIIEVFGSWCPNCHDAGVYLSELHDKYSSQGLSITGLAFELTGEWEKDVEQVRKFVTRNETKYPILIAGTADKADATTQLQVLDRVRSYPTMIFLDQAGNVRAIYTGFSGPATGEAHTKLRRQFEQLIEKILEE